MSESDEKSEKIELLIDLYRAVSREVGFDVYMDIEGDKMILRRDNWESDGDIQIEIYAYTYKGGHYNIGLYEWEEKDGFIFSSIEKEEIGVIGDIDDWIERGIIYPLEYNEVPDDVLEVIKNV